MGWGNAIASVLGYAGQRDTNKQNKREASKNRAFQERMSNTSHQREIADLKSAGLNPILSAKSGASSPSGAMARVENATSSAMDAMRLKQEVENMKAQGNLIEQDRYLKRQQSGYYRQLKYRTGLEGQAQFMALEGAKTEGEIDKTKFGEYMRYLDRTMKSVTGTATSARALNNSRN
nr:MAG: DNA pilot protein [Microvirus sp.]